MSADSKHASLEAPGAKRARASEGPASCAPWCSPFAVLLRPVVLVFAAAIKENLSTHTILCEQREQRQLFLATLQLTYLSHSSGVQPEAIASVPVTTIAQARPRKAAERNVMGCRHPLLAGMGRGRSAAASATLLKPREAFCVHIRPHGP